MTAQLNLDFTDVADSKNQVQFQKGYSLIDFFTNYGSEDQCTEALFKWRWPDVRRQLTCPVGDNYSHAEGSGIKSVTAL